MQGGSWITRCGGAFLILIGLLVSACGGASSSNRPAATRVAPAPATDRAASPTSWPASSAAARQRQDRQPFTTSMSQAGPVLMTTLHGAASGVTMKVWVWLPPQYYQPAYAHTAFPALMLYPGGNGADHNLWAGTRMHGIEIDAQGARAGKLTPFVFVMPAMQLRQDLDTECADLPGQPKIGTFLAVDVRQMIEKNFRVIHDRTGWGAMGVSAGAYCASRIVYNHPDQYAALASLDGYFTIETNVPGGNDPAVRAGDPSAIATRTAPPLSVLLYAGSGGSDLTTAQHFLAHVRPPTQAQLMIQPGGRHLTDDVIKMVPAAFAYLSAHLARPTSMSKA